MAIEASIKLKYGSKVPLNMFMLTFSADEDIHKIYEINSILRCNVNILPFRISKLIPQCKKCQDYGHTKNYCSNGPRCVKCTGNYFTHMCTKLENVQPKCVHCKGAHPAHFRGCKKALLKQKFKDKNLRTKVQQKSSKQLPSISGKPTTVIKKQTAKPAATSVGAAVKSNLGQRIQ